MKFSRRSRNSIGRWSGKFTAGLILAAFVVSPAHALTGDTIAPLSAQTQAAPGVSYAPGVQEIMKMVEAKVDPAVLQAYIKNSPTAYTLSADVIIDLKKKGVPDEIITGMIQHGSELRAQAGSAAQAYAATAPAPANPPPTGPYAPAAGYDSDFSDSDYPYYTTSSPGYYGYPYYGYPYSYSYWWNYGYPWYGFYSPFYYYNSHGHHHYYGYNHDHSGHNGHGYNGYNHGSYGHGSGYYNGHSNGRPGYGSPGRGQPWQPVGTYAGRSSSRSSFSPAGNFAARPSGSMMARSGSFNGGGLHGGGGMHSGGGFGGRSGGGGGGHR